MSVQLTIRGVPQHVRDELAARAASEGKSMQEFLRGELERIASRPTVAAWLESVQRRKAANRTRVSAAKIVRARERDRR
ncbi:MAG TPA: hypothetical protein VMJ74_13740 [Pseudomonadales bacterium]|nr:hypothetical protein [Pseudomonadales bacterium]